MINVGPAMLSAEKRHKCHGMSAENAMECPQKHNIAYLPL